MAEVTITVSGADGYPIIVPHSGEACYMVEGDTLTLTCAPHLLPTLFTNADGLEKKINGKDISAPEPKPKKRREALELDD